MNLFFGKMLLGKTDSFDYECIKTEFLIIGYPLIPGASFYITPSERRSAFLPVSDDDPTNQPIWRHTPIRTHAKSVRAAYARWWGTILVALIVLSVSGSRWSGVWTMLLGLLWCTASIVLSRPSGRAKKERRAFARATGVGAWPEIQYRDTVERVFEKLKQTWRERHAEKSGQRAWSKIKPAEIKAEDLADYYALCRYLCVLKGDRWTKKKVDTWARKTEAVWTRLEAMPVE